MSRGTFKAPTTEQATLEDLDAANRIRVDFKAAFRDQVVRDYRLNVPIPVAVDRCLTARAGVRGLTFEACSGRCRTPHRTDTATTLPPKRLLARTKISKPRCCEGPRHQIKTHKGRQKEPWPIKLGRSSLNWRHDRSA